MFALRGLLYAALLLVVGCASCVKSSRHFEFSSWRGPVPETLPDHDGRLGEGAYRVFAGLGSSPSAAVANQGPVATPVAMRSMRTESSPVLPKVDYAVTANETVNRRL